VDVDALVPATRGYSPLPVASVTYGGSDADVVRARCLCVSRTRPALP
jgi:hypothetical protein